MWKMWKNVFQKYNSKKMWKMRFENVKKCAKYEKKQFYVQKTGKHIFQYLFLIYIK